MGGNTLVLAFHNHPRAFSKVVFQVFGFLDGFEISSGKKARGTKRGIVAGVGGYCKGEGSQDEVRCDLHICGVAGNERGRS